MSTQETAPFAYDEVPYDTEANADAHPRSMATLARLFGIEGAPPSSARVLEIGCGDGEHMIAAASYLPRARFVGFNLSGEAVLRGIDSAKASGVGNAEFLHRDVRDVKKERIGEFDYVVAHGVYSWVPEAIRPDVLGVMRDALAPNGVAFVSMNALPGWELRRALRSLMREASASAADPAAKVAAAMAVVDDLAALAVDEDVGFDFSGVLARAAREYRDHVTRATPPGAPFSRYVFHDLLAECNDPFSVDDLATRAAAAGLRILCDTPGARPVDDLRRAMTESGAPFLQALLCRDDASPRASVDVSAIADMHLWADLAPAGSPGLYRTTAGAVLRAAPDTPFDRAARQAPGFVAVRELATDDAVGSAFLGDLLGAFREGLLVVATEAAPIAAGLPARPRVSPHVRARAAGAVVRNAPAAVLTSALHRSFRVPWAELLVIRDLDGTRAEPEVALRTTDAVASAPRELLPLAIASAKDRHVAVTEHVRVVVDRFRRHGFLLEDAP